MLLCAAGGVLDACVFLCYGRVFANAQTGNLVLLAIDAITGHAAAAVAHVRPILGFVCGVIGSTLMARHWPDRWPDAIATRLCGEAAILAMLAIVAPLLTDAVVTGTVGLLAAVQVGTLSRIGDIAFNSAMTTSNLRTALTELTASRVNDASRDRLMRGLFSGALAASFVAGAAVGAVAALRWGGHAFALAALLLPVAAWVDRRGRQPRPSAAL